MDQAPQLVGFVALALIGAAIVAAVVRSHRRQEAGNLFGPEPQGQRVAAELACQAARSLMDTLEGQFTEAARLAGATRSALDRDESSDEFIPGLAEATLLEWTIADAARTRLQVSVLMAATLSRAIEVYPPGSLTGGGLGNASEAVALAHDRARRGAVTRTLPQRLRLLRNLSSRCTGHQRCTSC